MNSKYITYLFCCIYGIKHFQVEVLKCNQINSYHIIIIIIIIIFIFYIYIYIMFNTSEHTARKSEIKLTVHLL